MVVKSASVRKRVTSGVGSSPMLCCYGSYATNHAEQQILPLGSCSLISQKNTLDGTACTLSCFLTLETEHLVFCHIAIN